MEQIYSELDMPRHTLFDDHSQYVRPNKETCLMAVNAWERRNSKTLYMYSSFKFIGVIAEMIKSIKNANQALDNKVLDSASKVVEETQIANMIYVRNKYATEEKLHNKEKHYDNAVAYLTTLTTNAYIFLRNECDSGRITEETYSRYMGEIAVTANSIISLIKGAKKSDRSSWKDIQSNESNQDSQIEVMEAISTT